MIKYLIIAFVILLLIFLYINQKKRDLFIPLVILTIIFVVIIILAFIGY